MSLIKTDMFKIDGMPMFAPDENVGISWQDLDSSDSGRDQAGNMHRTVIKHDVATWQFHYTAVTDEEMAYMKSLFYGKADFLFTHPDPYDKSSLVTVRAYRSKHDIKWENARTGNFRNYSFNIIETGEGDDYV